MVLVHSTIKTIGVNLGSKLLFIILDLILFAQVVSLCCKLAKESGPIRVLALEVMMTMIPVLQQ
jgi:hypothetical protein